MDRNSVKPLEELLDSVRDIDGFPIGEDEDILALSDPPFYTACPNPYIKQFIEEHGKPYNPDNDDYERTPFVGDVSENKNDVLSNVHYYITKVPYKAIIHYIVHYTNPGDLIFDGFCGSGMTGLAAQMCEDIPNDLKKKLNERFKKPNFGRRYAILNELSPLASFISANYNITVDKKNLEKIALDILKKARDECSWMYETNHVFELKDKTKETLLPSDNEKTKGKINHVIWSDNLVCPYCNNEYVYWNAAINLEEKILLNKYNCPICGAEITKDECERAKETFFDSAIGRKVTQTKQSPVLINYSIRNKRYEKKLDEHDLKLIDRIKSMEIPYWFPKNKIPNGDKTNEPIRLGMTHVHHFFSKRNLWTLSKIIYEIKKIDDKIIKNKLFFIITSLWLRASKKTILSVGNYFHGGGGYITTISGNMFIPSLFAEVSIIDQFKNRIKKTNKLNDHPKILNNGMIVSTNSSTNLKLIPDNSIDYIFIDPPFGKNLMYSELNFIPEAWLKVFENNETEAIMNNTQNKDLDDYTKLMTSSLKEMLRILKPNRWITVEFHNSRASVWNAIQESLARAGFIIAQVGVLDKQSGSFTSHVSPGAVENDLIITAYKPKKYFSERFLKSAGEGMEVDFIAQQLEHLPVTSNIERTEKMLYSRMLAHYVENGFKIKYDATNFYNLLSDNFTELDGYWFLERQVKEYNEWKSGLSLDQMKELVGGQQVLFVSDEKSVITWMHNFLHTPRDYSEIYTAYQQVATITDDVVPEPKELLDNNFILEDGKYRRPISQKEKESTNKNRDRELDYAFNKLLKQAREQKGKIQNVRREALVHGFTRCYQEGRYRDILTVADRLYASTLESSGDIMDFVDIARIKTAGKKEVENYK